MTPRSYRRSRPLSYKIELAPLLDVIFILLIFFAVSTSLILNHHGIQLNLPNAATADTEYKGVVLSIDQDQQLFLDDELISDSQLMSVISSHLETSPTFQVVLRADKQTPYHFVIHILDTVRLSGCSNVVLEVEKPIDHGA